MRSYLPRYLTHLTIPIVLLATVGTLFGTTGTPLGTSAACGCEAEFTIEATDKSEEIIDTDMTVTNLTDSVVEIVRLEEHAGTGLILSTGNNCTVGTRLAALGGSCTYLQDDPPGSAAVVRPV
jgi:hypothetical protein